MKPVFIKVHRNSKGQMVIDNPNSLPSSVQFVFRKVNLTKFGKQTKEMWKEFSIRNHKKDTGEWKSQSKIVHFVIKKHFGIKLPSGILGYKFKRWYDKHYSNWSIQQKWINNQIKMHLQGE